MYLVSRKHRENPTGHSNLWQDSDPLGLIEQTHRNRKKVLFVALTVFLMNCRKQ